MRTIHAAVSESAPSGTLAMNTARHPNVATTRPASIGPMMAPMPTMVMNIPMTLPRSLAGNVVVSIAIALAWIIADPAPWMIRNRITVTRLGDSAAMAAPSTNTMKPQQYTTLRADHVREPPGGEQHRAGGKHVPERDPLYERYVGPEVGRHLGQRQSYPSLVEHGHKRARCDG